MTNLPALDKAVREVTTLTEMFFAHYYGIVLPRVGRVVRTRYRKIMEEEGR
jgi:hypothetical protein